MYNRILLTIDGSENAIRAAKEAVKIATLCQHVHVEIVYVIAPPKTHRELLLTPTDKDKEKIRSERIAPVEELLKESEIDYSVIIFHGDPAQTIIDYEDESQFDLLVIGSRGLNVVQKLMMGSVSSKVIQKVGCPVLMVK